jgi:1,4-dihydroxy-2-naphthoate octaprenyltransferase
MAVRLGDKRARTALLLLLIVAQLSSALIFLITPWGLLTLLVLPLTISISKEIMSGASGKALIPLLGKTGKLQLAMALLITLALTLGRA